MAWTFFFLPTWSLIHFSNFRCPPNIAPQKAAILQIGFFPLQKGGRYMDFFPPPRRVKIRSKKKPSERLPSPILDRLLQDPYHLQRRVSFRNSISPWWFFGGSGVLGCPVVGFVRIKGDRISGLKHQIFPTCKEVTTNLLTISYLPGTSKWFYGR